MVATVDALSAVPLFHDLPQATLDRVARFARPRSFKAGETIFKEGEEGIGFFLISDGEVAVTRGATPLATLGAGGWFGEMALLDNHRRSATVAATKDTNCLALMRSDFLAELRSSPDMAIDMLGVMSARLRDLDEKLSHQ